MVTGSPGAPILVGTAGWAIPQGEAEAFPTGGTHLERYARMFGAVEINSSFHRPHRASTYARWAASVGPGFRFSVKVPKAITHTARLQKAERLLDEFLAGVRSLGDTLGCLLVQLPPSLPFDPAVTRRFFATMRDLYPGGIGCEPRHASWLQPEAEETLASLRVARVAADPDRPAGAGKAGGWSGFRYYRLHGSPKMYYSGYSEVDLDGLAGTLTRDRTEGRTAWCIFDNTAAGAAMSNALSLVRRLKTDGSATRAR